MNWPIARAGIVTSTVLVAVVALLGGGSASRGAPNTAMTLERGGASAASGYGKLPLAFEANGGRTDKRVDFIARGAGYTLFLTPRESVLALGRGERGAVLRTRLIGAAHRRGVPEAVLPGKVNSLIGKKSQWRTGISTFRKVRYRSVYPRTDLIYYGHGGRLEYDFVLRPGADPGRIGLGFTGAHGLRVNSRGDLVIATRAGSVRQHRPVAYQEVNGRRRPVKARFVLRGRRVALRVGDYDKSRPLVVDPILGYSTTLGGSDDEVEPGNEASEGVAVGADGSAFVTGTTQSTDFPLVSPQRSALGDATDAFVTKLSPDGKSIVFSTYLGGSGIDNGYGVAVTPAGAAVVVGLVRSSDFPVTPDGLKTTLVGRDGFAVQLTTDGAGITWGTFLGGDTQSDEAWDVAVDPNGDVLVTGYTASTNFQPQPSTYGTQQTLSGGPNDAFLVKLHYDPATPQHLTAPYSTFLGGASSDVGTSVAVDSAGGVYLAGDVGPSGFAAPNATGKPTGQTLQDGFAAKIDTTVQNQANSLVWLVYVGGNGIDEINGIGVTSYQGGTAYVVGTTTSTNLPNIDATAPFTGKTSGNLQDRDGFLVEILDPPFLNNGFLIDRSVYFHGSGWDEAKDIAVRTNGLGYITQYVAGYTNSDDFPTSNSLQGTGLTAGQNQAFVLKRHRSGTPPAIWSTALGGLAGSDEGAAIAVDSQGKAYVAGEGGSDFPRKNAAQDSYGGGLSDAFVSRIDQGPPIIDPDPNPSSGPVNPTNGSVVASNSVEFNYHASEAGEPSLPFKCNQVDGTGHITSATRDSTNGCIGPPMHYTGLAEGQHTFEVVAVDRARDESDPADARIVFTVDTHAPPAFDLGDPADGAFTDRTPTLSWQRSHDALTAVTYHLLIDGQDVQQVPESACANDICSAKLANALVTGGHSWRVRAVDAAGNATDSPSRSFTAIEPPTARLTVSPNPALIGRDVNFDGTASNDPAHIISKYEWDLDGDGAFETDTGAVGATKKAYPTPGTVSVSLRVTDTSGVSATTTQELRITSAGGTAGLLGVTINNGAQYTRSPDVVVTATFPPATTNMLFSNDGGFLIAGSFPPQKETKWKLDSSGPERLPKTLYVRFFTGPFPSETFQDDIILDEVPPKVVTAAVTAAGVATARATALRKWTLKVKATDSNSGVAGVQATANKRKPGKLLKYKRKLTVKSAVRPKWVRARDKAGNYSRWRKAR